MSIPRFTEQQFAIALCLGRHSVDLECGVLTLRVTLERDDDQTPPEFPYDTHQRQTFDAELWCYWGAVLSLHVGSRCVDEHAASLWRIDCVDPCIRDASHLAEIANGLVRRGDVLKTLRHLRADVLHAVDDWLEAQGGATCGR
jgi:hypothetical protein